MKLKTKVYTAIINGTNVEVKAYFKVNALARFKYIDPAIKMYDIQVAEWATNSQQTPVEILFPDICKKFLK